MWRPKKYETGFTQSIFINGLFDCKPFDFDKMKRFTSSFRSVALGAVVAPLLYVLMVIWRQEGVNEHDIVIYYLKIVRNCFYHLCHITEQVLQDGWAHDWFS